MKKKVAMFHPEFRVRGGAERKILLLYHALKRKYDITVITFIWNPKTCFTELCKGVNVKVISGFRPIAILKMAVAGRKYDLIHANNNPSHLAASLTRILFRKPVIWFCNEPILYLEDTVRRKNKILLHVQRIVERILIKPINTIVANSQNTAMAISKHLGIFPRIIYSGVDTNKYKPRRKKKSNVLRLITVSRIEKHKNIDFILDRLPEWNHKIPISMTIIGDGSHLKHLQKRKEKERIWILKLLGSVSEEEKIRELQNSDIFIFPSKNEPLGVTPIEAMACGIPVLGFDSGGLIETVGSGGGVLMDNENEFGEFIKWLANDKKQRNTLGKEGRNIVKKAFSVKEMVRQTDKLYGWYLEDRKTS